MLGVHQEEHRVKLAYARSWKPDERTGKVDLPAIQADIERQHKTFRLSKLMYDQAQAVLMAQQLQQAGIYCEEMSFSGKGLSVMATTIIEAFKGRYVELYRDAELISDLAKLNIVERAFGFKIEASEDQSGHADRAFAFAIALPAAVELAAILPVNPFVDRDLIYTMDGLEKRLYEIEHNVPPEARNPEPDGFSDPDQPFQDDPHLRTIPCDACFGKGGTCPKCQGARRIPYEQAVNRESAVMTMALEENGLGNW